MDADFWHQRWQTARIGFHQQDINHHLRRCWHNTAASPGAGVLVPLCGKSRDMHWLAQQGHAVTGFELSPLALDDFFNEAGLQPQRSLEGPYVCWRSGSYRLYQGDFFAAGERKQRFDLAYDRAALIALPAHLRPRYAALLARLMRPAGRILLVTVDYAPVQDLSPPFAVNEAEVRALFESDFEVELLERTEEGPQNRRVAAGECTFFDELCFLLTRH